MDCVICEKLALVAADLGLPKHGLVHMDCMNCFQCNKGFTSNDQYNKCPSVEFVAGRGVRHKDCNTCICGYKSGYVVHCRDANRLFKRSDKTLRCIDCIGCNCGHVDCTYLPGSAQLSSVTPHSIQVGAEYKLYVQSHCPCSCGYHWVGVCQSQMLPMPSNSENGKFVSLTAPKCLVCHGCIHAETSDDYVNCEGQAGVGFAHGDCIKNCNICKKSNITSTDSWLVYDNSASHAKCSVCSECGLPGGGGKCGWYKDHGNQVPRIMHAKCRAARNKQIKQSKTANKRRKLDSYQ